MTVETYSTIRFKEVYRLVEKFHSAYLHSSYGQISAPVLQKTIGIFEERPEHGFILTHDGKAVGLLGGIEVKSELSEQRFYQEILWYIEPPHGHKMLWFLRKIQTELKNLGFSSMIISVFESPNSEKLRSVCERIGFKKLETHYSKGL